MKKSELTFMEGFMGIQAMQAKGSVQKAFDWDKAALIIKDKFAIYPDLIAEAGLQRDWNYTGGIIFENKQPTDDYYTYLSSNWAIPTLILSWDNKVQEEIECWCEENSRMHAGSKWDEISLNMLK